jgi:quinol monooxygenase YgiN
LDALGNIIGLRKGIKMEKQILITIRYVMKPGKRNEFLQKIDEFGIIRKSKAEKGNIKYDYSLPLDSKDDVLLMEMWGGDTPLALHKDTEHFKKLQSLKDEYVLETKAERFYIEKI